MNVLIVERTFFVFLARQPQVWLCPQPHPQRLDAANENPAPDVELHPPNQSRALYVFLYNDVLINRKAVFFLLQLLASVRGHQVV